MENRAPVFAAAPAAKESEHLLGRIAPQVRLTHISGYNHKRGLAKERRRSRLRATASLEKKKLQDLRQISRSGICRGNPPTHRKESVAIALWR
ncbi:MAG: hypothetical protein F6J93_23675 [Oscillatoria sp. SIO1A7]|nr:hypothetical protein [Oscillatoria sp. SIO1A7]